MGTLTGHGQGLGASRRELELGGLSSSGQAATGPVPGLGKPRCLCSWGLSCRGPGLQSALLALWRGDGTGRPLAPSDSGVCGGPGWSLWPQPQGPGTRPCCRQQPHSIPWAPGTGHHPGPWLLGSAGPGPALADLVIPALSGPVHCRAGAAAGAQDRTGLSSDPLCPTYFLTFAENKPRCPGSSPASLGLSSMCECGLLGQPPKPLGSNCPRLLVASPVARFSPPAVFMQPPHPSPCGRQDNRCHPARLETPLYRGLQNSRQNRGR